MVKTQWVSGQLPLFLPESDWKPVTELPDLSHFNEISLDTETRDFSLSAGRGPGSYTRSGYVVGLSLAWRNGAIYVPLRHPESFNFDHEQVGKWIKDHFSYTHIKWVLHNAGYDLSWIYTEWGINPPRYVEDTGALAALVDENRYSYKLDDLAKWRGIAGKDENLLKEIAASYGVQENVKANLWQFPAKFVGPYAEQDAVATLQLAQSLRKEINEQGLEEACRVEMGLIPMVLKMSQVGIRIDTNRAEQTRDALIKKRNEELTDLSNQLGHTVGMDEINSARHIEQWFTTLNLPFNRTPKSFQGKFDSEFLEKHPHWLPQKISKIRQIDRAQSVFITEYLLDFVHNGRIHASINQFRNEGGGTRSHRFSYNSPPLQQMPARDSTELKKQLAEAIRGCFLPEPNQLWGSHDLSQQEYRIIVHFAELLKCSKANIAGDKYRNDPMVDFHNLVAEMTKLERKKAKDVNFAKAFGAGVAKFALMTGMPFEEAKETMNQYDLLLPFVKEAAQECQRIAEKRGYIRLIDGARSRFDMHEVAFRKFEQELGHDCFPTDIKTVMSRVDDKNHPWYKKKIIRAYTHKAFNRLIQGSAARQVKKAMLDCWNEGYIPLLQIHDELCFSHETENEGRKINELMRDAIKLTVPMRCDSEYGINWGTAKVIKNKEKEVLYDASWTSAQKLQKEGKWW